MYPIVSNTIYKITQTTAITNYKAEIVNKDKEEIKEIKEEYKKHNKAILENSISSVDLIEDGEVLGYIQIPKLKLELAIYEGTEDKYLQQGVGHMKNTSLPGEKDTHTVLAGHSGLSKAKIFDDIEKLKLGDIFEITILDNTYTYKIDQIKTVEKDNVTDLKVIKGKELVTLVTCTPKFINSHRLLVRGKRIQSENEYEIVEETTHTSIKKEVIFINIDSILILIIIILLASALLISKKDVILIKK